MEPKYSLDSQVQVRTVAHKADLVRRASALTPPHLSLQGGAGVLISGLTRSHSRTRFVAPWRPCSCGTDNKTAGSPRNPRANLDGAAAGRATREAQQQMTRGRFNDSGASCMTAEKPVIPTATKNHAWLRETTDRQGYAIPPNLLGLGGNVPAHSLYQRLCHQFPLL